MEQKLNLGFNIKPIAGLEQEIHNLNNFIKEKILSQETLGDNYKIYKDASNHKELIDEILKLMGNGCLLKDILHFTDDHIEAIYNYGYQLYENGKFDDAIEIFKNLTIIDPLYYNGYFGLAASFQQKKNFIKAIEFYVLSSVYNPSDPMPYYYAAECYLELNDVFAAIVSLSETIKKAKKDKKYESLKNRCIETKKILELELDKILDKAEKTQK